MKKCKVKGCNKKVSKHYHQYCSKHFKELSSQAEKQVINGKVKIGSSIKKYTGRKSGNLRGGKKTHNPKTKTAFKKLDWKNLTDEEKRKAMS